MPENLFEARVRTDGAVTVLAVRGEIDMHTAPEFSKALRDALVRSTSVLVVDMTEIAFLASTGLSELVHASQQATRQGAAFRLAGGQRGVLRAIGAAGLMDVFEHHETVDAAIG